MHLLCENVRKCGYCLHKCMHKTRLPFTSQAHGTKIDMLFLCSLEKSKKIHIMSLSTCPRHWNWREISSFVSIQESTTTAGFLNVSLAFGSTVVLSIILQLYGTWIVLTMYPQSWRRSQHIYLLIICMHIVTSQPILHHSRLCANYTQELPVDFHIQTLFVGKPRVACSIEKDKVFVCLSMFCLSVFLAMPVCPCIHSWMYALPFCVFIVFVEQLIILCACVSEFNFVSEYVVLY